MKRKYSIKTILLAFVAVLSFLSFNASAAPKITTNYNKVSDGYNFWLVQPEGDSVEKKPVVIFLHGASLCGNDLNKVRRYGTLSAVEKGRDIDAYVIAPQNPGGAWKPSKIMNILEWVEKNYNVDTDRVYVLGMSLGGYGTIDFAATYPDKVAAAMAFCGGGTVKDLSGLGELPLWIVHGTADNRVSVQQSDRVVSAVKNTGNDSRLIYDRIPGMNHSQPARLFYLEDTYKWLFSHSLADDNRKATKKFTISDGLMKTAYSGLNHKAGYRSSSSKATKTSSVKSSSVKSSSKKSSKKSKTYAAEKSSRKRS